jgi:type IV secretion system protein TrbL
MANTGTCEWWDAVCKGKEGIQNVADGAIAEFVKSIYEGAVAFVAQVSTFWLDTPSPDVANTAVASLRADMSWYVAGFAILGFFVGLIKLVTSQDIKSSLIGIATPIVNLILATAVYATGIGLLLTASDQFARWIVQRSTGGEIDFTQLLTTSGALLASPGTAFLMFIILFIGALINLLFMYFRDVMFLILSAFIIVLAAASGSESGRQAWRKANGWLIALLLFKPVAAGIYSLGFRMLVNGATNTDGKETTVTEAIHASLMAILILVLAALALPALVKFVVPAAGVGAGAFSGGAALGAGVTLAAGAAVIASGGAAAPAVAGGAAGGAGVAAGGSAGAAAGGAAAGGGGAVGASGRATAAAGGGGSGAGNAAASATPGGGAAGANSDGAGSAGAGGSSGSSGAESGGAAGGGPSGTGLGASGGAHGTVGAGGSSGAHSGSSAASGSGAPASSGTAVSGNSAPGGASGAASGARTGNGKMGAALQHLNGSGPAPQGSQLEKAINDEGGE